MTISQRIQAMAFCETPTEGQIIEVCQSVSKPFRDQLKRYGKFVRTVSFNEKTGYVKFKVCALKKP